MSATLSEDVLIPRLACFGRHPLNDNHAFLELNISDLTTIRDINILRQYKHLMYLNISGNEIEDLSPLSDVTALTQLVARNNRVSRCVGFFPKCCRPGNAWSTGDKAIGSILSSLDLGNNLISVIDGLDEHVFIEVLLLGKNLISKIDGLQALKNLRVLDLSYNKISRMENLQGLPIQELNLKGNQISDISGVGLSELPRLSVLDLSENKIKSLTPLQFSTNLEQLDLRNNKISMIRQLELLEQLSFLQVLLLHGNPCAGKSFYRARVIIRLPSLQRLDFTKVIAEERIRAANAYRFPQGDLISRQNVFNKYITDQEFLDYCTPLHDEEMAYSLEELLAGETLATTERKVIIEKEVIRELSEAIVYEVLEGVNSALIYA